MTVLEFIDIELDFDDEARAAWLALVLPRQVNPDTFQWHALGVGGVVESSGAPRGGVEARRVAWLSWCA